MKVVVFGSEVFHSAVSQSSAYNVHTFNRSARVEETWTTVLGLSGQMHNFRSADANALFEEHHSHMRRVTRAGATRRESLPAVSYRRRATSGSCTCSSRRTLSFVAMFTFAYSGGVLYKEIPSMESASDDFGYRRSRQPVAWRAVHLSKVDSADQYPELMSTFPGGL
uniref:Uncharacterized protein n=1 Tax=Trichuris muris TaxID=70415 RepID=A0A5S6QC49_TRIMR